jgi:hypothetical protein
MANLLFVQVFRAARNSAFAEKFEEIPHTRGAFEMSAGEDPAYQRSVLWRNSPLTPHLQVRSGHEIIIIPLSSASLTVSLRQQNSGQNPVRRNRV